MENLIKVSAGKTATQSSTSKWSRPNESANALKSICKEKFAFHTDREDNPWWMVDLGDIYPIHSIVIGNRFDKFHEKARTLRVELSRDGRVWDTVHSGFTMWRFEQTFMLENEMIGRYLRLSLDEKNYFHLTKVEVWSKRSDLTVVCNRADGFGCRLEGLVRGGYLAKVLNADLKVRWRDVILGAGDTFSGTKKIDNREILGHSIEQDREIFADDFVDTHFEAGKLANASKVSSKENLTAAGLHTPDLQNEQGVIYAPGGYSDVSYNPYLAPNPAYGYSDAFLEIKFNAKMQAAIDAAHQIPLRQKKAAVHIRSGDIVYGDYRKQGRRFMRKAVPMPMAQMALHRLLKDGYHVMVFGEDMASIAQLQEEFPDILLAKDQNTAGYTGPAGALFDIVLMSRMDVIWAGDSGFARIAHDISRYGTFHDMHKLFDMSDVIAFFKKQIPKSQATLHPRQTAYSLWYLYSVSKGLSVDEQLGMLDQLHDIDPTNPVYRIQKTCVLLGANMHSKAERVIGEYLFEGWQSDTAWGGTEALKCLMAGNGGLLHLRTLVKQAEERESAKHPNVLFFLAAIAAGKKNTVRAKTLLDMAKLVRGRNPLIDQVTV